MKRLDLAFVILFPLLILLFVFFSNLQMNYIESLIVIFGVPSAYLSIRNQEKIKKVATFSLILAIPVTIVFDLIAAFGDNAWFIPNSIFNYRLFGVILPEDFLWSFLVAYVIIIFYESFCNKKFQKGISSRMWKGSILLYLAMIVVILIFILNSSLLKIPYSYFWLGTIFWLIPVILFLSRYRSFFWSFLKVDLFFFYLYWIYEIVGLKLNIYVFQGLHYIGWISVLGFRFPMEEFIFIMILGGFAACTYYEFLTNKHLRT